MHDHKMHKILFNEYGRLRSGWRVFLFLFLLLASSFVFVTALRVGYATLHTLIPRPSYASAIFELIFRCTLIISALGAGYLLAKYVEGLPFRSLGLTFHEGWLRDFLLGCAVAFATLVLAVVISVAAGNLRFSLNAAEQIPAIIKSFIGSGILLFVAALAEEAMFRGYPLQTLARAGYAWLGVVLTLAFFAWGHLDNPNVVPQFTFANTALAGLWFAIAYLRTRSLWLPLGLHWAWNWALGWFFGLPISGLKLVSHPVLVANDGGPFWLTGGTYGMEGGLACTIAFALSTLLIWRMPGLKATPELKKLTSEENPAVRSPVLSSQPAE
jgi:uncharacterized protein